MALTLRSFHFQVELTGTAEEEHLLFSKMKAREKPSNKTNLPKS